MNKEFHYEIIYYLAREAGFNEDDCKILAYSSEYVDGNNIGFIFNNGSDSEYRNLISQTSDFIKPKKKLMRIYFSFHFVPGDYTSETARRKDGKLSILNTTPNSINVNKLIDEALKTKNIYRIGIATHAYADSWAHQNFIGYHDSINAMKDILAKILPNCGHADAKHKPDIPGLIWNDKRLITSNAEVSNKERFIDASKNIFKKYHYYINGNDNNLSIKWRNIESKLDSAIGIETKNANQRKYQKRRINKYKELLNNGNYETYKITKWISEAIQDGIHGLSAREPMLKFILKRNQLASNANFYNSHWYKFQEAIKEHQKFCEYLYKPIFDQIELKNL